MPASPGFLAVILLGGSVLIYLSQQLGLNLPPHLRHFSIIPAAIGILIFLFGVWASQRKRLPRWLTRLITSLSGWFGVHDWQAALLFLSLPYAALVPLAAGPGVNMYSPIPALFGWVISIGMATAGGWSRTTPLRAPGWKQIAWFIGLSVVAFLPRGLFTGEIPILLTGDEGSAGLAALSFVNFRTNNIFNTGWYSFPSLFFFIQSISISIFGRTTEALRIPSAIAGALTVTALYYAGRAMFGKRAGLLSALFLACSHYHIHFSRIGLNNIWDGLWYVVTVGALWYGWEKGRRNAYLLAGISLGLSQYFYPSSRTLLVLILGWIFIVALIDRSRFKHALPDLVVFILATIVVMLPLLLFYIQHPNEYLAPFARVSLLGNWLERETAGTGQPAWWIILKQLGTGFQAFTYAPLRAWYLPGTPILLPLTAGLFIMGLILLCLRGGARRIVPILLWLAAFGAIGGLSESTPAAQRYIAVAPVCALVAGYGLSEFFLFFERLWPKRARLFAISTFVIAFFTVAVELHFYFFKYTPSSVITQARSNGMIAQRLADYLQQNDTKDLQVVFFGYPYMGYYSIPSIQYLVPDVPGIDINFSWGSSENQPVNGDHLLFVFLPNHQHQINAVRSDFPRGRLHEEIAADDMTLYWLYEYQR